MMNYETEVDEWQWALPQTTPRTTNETEERESRADQFKKHDPVGIIMALTAMSVVFLALLVLYQTFKLMGKIMVRSAEKKETKSVAGEVKESANQDVNGEIIAAIGIAIRKYEDDLHDLESTVITINRVARAYSPWSSKIYGIMNQPTKK